MKLARLILLLAVIIFLAVYGVPWVLENTLHTDIPMLTVTSGSMWPILKVGDLAFITAPEPDDLKVGDIIVFEHKDGLSIHRVVRVGWDSITTKGDANTAEDNPISYDAVVGKAVMWGEHLVKIPFLGSLGKLAQNRTVFYVIVALLIVTVLVLTVYEMVVHKFRLSAVTERRIRRMPRHRRRRIMKHYHLS